MIEEILATRRRVMNQRIEESQEVGGREERHCWEGHECWAVAGDGDWNEVGTAMNGMAESARQ